MKSLHVFLAALALKSFSAVFHITFWLMVFVLYWSVFGAYVHFMNAFLAQTLTPFLAPYLFLVFTASIFAVWSTWIAAPRMVKIASFVARKYSELIKLDYRAFSH
jgi:hypothetical protein